MYYYLKFMQFTFCSCANEHRKIKNFQPYCNKRMCYLTVVALLLFKIIFASLLDLLNIDVVILRGSVKTIEMVWSDEMSPLMFV